LWHWVWPLQNWYQNCLRHYLIYAAHCAKKRKRNECRGRIAYMMVTETLRMDTDEGIKPNMAFLALLQVCLPGQ
jgi:hypothetical protein